MKCNIYTITIFLAYLILLLISPKEFCLTICWLWFLYKIFVYGNDLND